MQKRDDVMLALKNGQKLWSMMGESCCYQFESL